jgi:phospholipase/carboxylesterase
MPLTAMSHVHDFIPGIAPTGMPLVLLHGSGGDENELVPLAADLAPESPALAVRGGIPFDGGFAFSIACRIGRSTKPMSSRVP